MDAVGMHCHLDIAGILVFKDHHLVRKFYVYYGHYFHRPYLFAFHRVNPSVIERHINGEQLT